MIVTRTLQLIALLLLVGCEPCSVVIAGHCMSRGTDTEDIEEPQTSVRPPPAPWVPGAAPRG